MNAPIGMKNIDYHNRPIGSILVDEGRLRLEDAERILQVQRTHGLRFGEAARRMKLLSEDDVQYALARQFDYPHIVPGTSKLSGELIAAYQPFAPVVETLRAARNQLMLRRFGTHGHQHALAVVSPEAGEGRSWLAANLAIVFSQLGQKTLLVDGDLRQPRQHQLFGISNATGLSALLAARNTGDVIQSIPELRNLDVLTAGAPAPNPQELLTRPFFATLLGEMCRTHDVVLFDTPPASECADGQMLAVRAGAALVLARDRRSHVLDIQRMVDDIQEAGAEVVGSLITRH